jgi:hypothetical protein
MVKRTLFIVLLGIGLTAPVGNEAFARVCIGKVGGICVLWSGSLVCGIGATGIGNVDPDVDPVYLACTGTGTGQWAVICGNPGTNDWTSPGVNLATFSGTLNSEVYQLTPYDVDRNGNAYGFAVAEPSSGLLTAITENGGCPNSNWSAIDALPCNLTLRDMQLTKDGCPTGCDKCVESEAYFDCELPSCATIGWDSITHTFETREYTCTKTGSNTYKDPVCP